MGDPNTSQNGGPLATVQQDQSLEDIASALAGAAGVEQKALPVAPANEVPLDDYIGNPHEVLPTATDAVVSISDEDFEEIPRTALVVKTTYSTYRFGPAKKHGERSVTREGKSLDFSTCKVISLQKGEIMRLTRIGTGSSVPWETSPVKSISAG
jgi:hypothetical protein